MVFVGNAHPTNTIAYSLLPPYANQLKNQNELL
jgi:hypothetical protein